MKCCLINGIVGAVKDSEKDVLCALKLSQKDVASLVNIKVKDLLCCPRVRVPSYQRGYCWVRKQVEGLLASVWSFPWASSNHPTLHLGTVVLHHTKSEDKQEFVYDIVDGQQRLVTLAILFKCYYERKQPSENNVTFPLLSTETEDPNVQNHVYWTAKIINQWLDSHDEIVEARLNNIAVDAVIINGAENLGLAYTFFNAINSAGKKLTDYDLLKPHHLRYLCDNDPKAYFASEWDRFVQEKVASFNGEAMLADELLDCTLYRLRCWSRNRIVKSEAHHVLEHFSAYETTMPGWKGLRGFFTGRDALDVGLGGGSVFFDYVRVFAERYRRFVVAPAVKDLLEINFWGGNLVLANFIRAILFFYFCKYGDDFLDDALVFIAERVGRLRADNPRIYSRKIFNDALLGHTVAALDESPSPMHFFHYCVMLTNRYKHVGVEDGNVYHQGRAFWEALKSLHVKVGSRLAFKSETGAIKKNYEHKMEGGTNV